MPLKIIAGEARGINLETPESRSMRPTSGKAREALFSSIGSVAGLIFADIFAGSGAIGLEAASRGAREVVFLESDARHCRMIERNLEKIRKAGADFAAEVLCRKATAAALRALPKADVWFFDPPYAESAQFFRQLCGDEALREHWRGALLIWELPDTAEASRGFEDGEALPESEIRTLGGVRFLWCVMP